MDFLELVNQVGRAVKKHSQEYKELPSKDSLFKEYGYDSLDTLMLTIYVSEAYGLPKEISEKLFPATVTELELSVSLHKTRDPASIQEVVDLV